MKWDPAEVFVNAIAITPIRLLVAWLAGSVGAFLPAVIGRGADAFEFLGWQIAFFPFYLVIMAFMSGWWGVIAVPLILVVAYKLCRFMISDNTGSELMVILTLAFLIAIRSGLDERLVMTAVVGISLLISTVVFVQRDRELYPE